MIGAASAGPVGLGGINPPETVTVAPVSESAIGIPHHEITFEYDFTLSNPATLTADFNLFTQGGLSSPENITLSLYEIPSLGVSNLLTSASASGSADAILSFAVAPGVLYAVFGDAMFHDLAFAANADSYQGSLKFTVAATPLPPALLMFGTALAALGGFGYSRRRSASAA
jgi:hypothetical protein